MKKWNFLILIIGIITTAIVLSSCTKISPNKIYVTNAGDGTVSVINGKTNKVIKTISVGNKPYSVGVLY